jgi:hypothetical protein
MFHDLQVWTGNRWRIVSSQMNVAGLMAQADRAKRDGEKARIIDPAKKVIYQVG